MKITQTIERVKSSRSDITHQVIPAHIRVGLACGPLAVHGCESIIAANRLLRQRLHAIR